MGTGKETKEERGEKRKREEEKEENVTGLKKEDMSLLFLWMLLTFVVKGAGELWWSFLEGLPGEA